MKNLFRIGVILILLTAYSFLIESCCPPDDRRIIGLYDVNIRQIVDSMSVDSDTIYGAFTLFTSGESEIVYQSHDLSLMSSAYALSCEDDNYLNGFVETSLKLTCDKDFTVIKSYLQIQTIHK